MAINKPDLPLSTLPSTWGGTQTAYTAEQISNGYEEAIPQIVDGGNINYEKKGLFENIEYLRTIVDFLRAASIGYGVYVNSNNQLDYIDLTEKEIPEQTGKNGKFLSTNGSDAFWTDAVIPDDLSPIYPVVETYVNGTEWYRVYSDGWVEQGGSFTCSSAGQTLTFLKAFANTNYIMTAAGGTNTYGTISFYDRTATYCKSWVSDDDSFNAGIINWFACGYGA